jgi:hypothetical protein
MMGPAVADMACRGEGAGEHVSERTAVVRERARAGGNTRIGRQGGDA